MAQPLSHWGKKNSVTLSICQSYFWPPNLRDHQSTVFLTAVVLTTLLLPSALIQLHFLGFEILPMMSRLKRKRKEERAKACLNHTCLQSSCDKCGAQENDNIQRTGTKKATLCCLDLSILICLVFDTFCVPFLTSLRTRGV